MSPTYTQKSDGECGWEEPRPARGWSWRCFRSGKAWIITGSNVTGDVPHHCPGCGVRQVTE